MHKMNVVGKKAIKQIMRAKPVHNKYTINAEARMREFEQSEKVRNFFALIKPDIIPDDDNK